MPSLQITINNASNTEPILNTALQFGRTSISMHSLDKPQHMWTLRHMITTGTELRELREQLGLSQARLAEVLDIPQHLLSSFELEKSPLQDKWLNKLNQTVPKIGEFSEIVTRKKRYRAHSYANDRYSEERKSRVKATKENSRYLSELRQLMSTEEPKFRALSLFSGIGGFSLGFRSAGFDISGFVELDDKLATIYKQNFQTAHQLGNDVTELKEGDIREFVTKSGPIDVIIGGPPCQGFSLSGKRKHDDPRNYLFQEYLRIIDAIRPKLAVVENVKLLTSMKSKNGGMVRDEIVNGLRTHGYRAKIFSVNAKEYGVPQHRERVFFVAVRDDLNVDPIFPQAHLGEGGDLFGNQLAYRTFADACSDLPFIESGEHSSDRFHKAVKHPDHVIEWLWDVPEGRSAHDNLDPNLRPPSGYNTTYKRQIWQEPASTVQTTFGMISGCRNVHPIATRSLTIREAARLQSFPDDFQFVGSLGTIRTGIGNAVPPLLSRQIALSLRAVLTDFVEVTGF